MYNSGNKKTAASILAGSNYVYVQAQDRSTMVSQRRNQRNEHCVQLESLIYTPAQYISR